jgi:hypothetical protein
MTEINCEACRDLLKQQMAAKGIEVTISTAPPIIVSPYEEACFTCPHGTTYWMEPTSGQVAAWARDGGGVDG